VIDGGYDELNGMQPAVWPWHRRQTAFIVNIKLLVRVCGRYAQLYRMPPVHETTNKQAVKRQS